MIIAVRLFNLNSLMIVRRLVTYRPASRVNAQLRGISIIPLIIGVSLMSCYCVDLLPNNFVPERTYTLCKRVAKTYTTGIASSANTRELTKPVRFPATGGSGRRLPTRLYHEAN